LRNHHVRCHLPAHLQERCHLAQGHLQVKFLPSQNIFSLHLALLINSPNITSLELS
jgi:hypothetical protein